MEISYIAKIVIYDKGHMRTSLLGVGDQQIVPIFKGKDKKNKKRYRTYMPGLYVGEVARREFSKSIFPAWIQEEAKKNTLTLDDLLREYGDKLTITVFVTGNDRLTGARKTFVSKEYTQKDIVEGRFKRWNGLPKGYRSLFDKTKFAVEIISQIDTIESIVKESYIDPIERLNNTNSRAKDQFLKRDDLRKPNNEYGMLKIDEIEDKIAELEHFLMNMNIEIAINPELKASISLLQYNLLKLNFVKSSYDYLHCYDSEKEEKRIRQKKYNKELYGVPDKAIFYAILREKKPEMVFEDVDKVDIAHPTETTFKRFSEMIMEYMSNLLSYIPDNKKIFSIQEACDIANRILDLELKASSFGWKAIVDSNSSVASVNQEKRLVKFPGKRSKGDYTVSDLRAIIVHELGVHVKRALVGNRIGSFALSVGLPYYEPFEEGLATAVEQAVNNKYSHRGYMHYLSLGFAEYEKLDFRGVFERQLEVFGNDTVNRKIIFDSVQRAFRGTGELTNCKDLAYFNGSELVWKYIEEHIDDKDLLKNLFEMGKIDNTREDHRNLVIELLSFPV